MNEKAEIDVIRRVYAPHSEGNFLEVRPWPDSPLDTLELRTTKECAEYFGAISLSLNVEFAEALARALLASVRDLRDAAVGSSKEGK